MTIPEEAIVAGAKAMDAYWGGRYAPEEVEELRGEVTAILEAVTPHMIAEALAVVADEFASRLPDGTGNGRAYNSYQVAHLLRAKSDEMRAK